MTVSRPSNKWGERAREIVDAPATAPGGIHYEEAEPLVIRIAAALRDAHDAGWIEAMELAAVEAQEWPQNVGPFHGMLSYDTARGIAAKIRDRLAQGPGEGWKDE